MNKKPLVSFSALMGFAAIVFVYFQMSTRPAVQVHRQATVHTQQVLAAYRDNCARCHGRFGEGFASNPVLRGKNFPAAQVKIQIARGQGTMPAFPNIQEPLLTELANFVSNL